MGRGTERDRQGRVTTWVALLLALPLLGALVACGASSGGSGLVEANQLQVPHEYELRAAQPRPFELFGHSLAVSGQLIAVGALGSADPASPGGSVRVFEPEEGEWMQGATLSPDVVADERFGHAVAASGRRVAVGAPYGSELADRAGVVYVYSKDVDGWFLEGQVSADAQLAGEYFGSSVAIAGDTLAVGASGPGGQAVYVFGWSGNQWKQAARLVADEPRDTGRFGSVIALDSETLAVSDWTDSDTEAGRVHLFHRSGDDWSQSQTIESGRAGDRFGRALALAGDLLVIAAPGDPSTARAYVYERVGREWRAEGELTASAGTGSGFAAAVAIVEDAIAVASAGSGVRAGEATVELFRKEGGKWTSGLVVEASGAGAESSFGTVLASSGALLIVGAPGDSEGGQSSGAVYAYEISQEGSSE